MKGLFIVLEGIDGSGKGSMAKRLKSLLSRKFGKNNIYLTTEPTNSVYGRQAKELQFNDPNPEDNMERCLHLYVLDRVHHIANVISPKLNSGKIVISDRYKYSTLVYQNVQGISFKHIIDLHKEMLVPDVTFVLDLSAEVAIKRMKKDRKRNKIFQKFEKLSFLKKVRTKFRELPKLLPEERIIIIDANRRRDSVFRDIKQKINEIYGF